MGNDPVLHRKLLILQTKRLGRDRENSHDRAPYRRKCSKRKGLGCELDTETVLRVFVKN